MRIICLALVAACLAGAAWAQGFAGADANGDGQIARAEAQAARVRAFERVDSDADGFVSAGEREAAASAAGARRGRLFERADDDRDGRVSRAEFLGQPLRAFDRFDANHDDVLQPGELDTMRSSARRPQP